MSGRKAIRLAKYITDYDELTVDVIAPEGILNRKKDDELIYSIYSNPFTPVKDCTVRPC